ncbi:MAG: ABC transporter substrate-binding protein [Acidimicrobiales bacterium]
MRRAISLVPSATDIVVALGAIESLVGISADCDQPDPAAPRPVVTTPMIDPGRAATDPAGVDAAVKDQLTIGGVLYSLDVELVLALAPDLVFAQDECAVCALPASEVVGTLASAGVHCEVVSLDPHSLDDVLATISTVARHLGFGEVGTTLEAACRSRLAALSAGPAARCSADRPRVAVLDWVEPLYLAGNWVPDVVRAAGGEPVLAQAGGRSRPIGLDALAAARPDVIVVAPCGLDLDAAIAGGRALRRLARDWAELKRARFVAFDGTVWFSRPGPGLVDGAEALAAWLSARRPSGSVRTAEIREASDDR